MSAEVVSNAQILLEVVTKFDAQLREQASACCSEHSEDWYFDTLEEVAEAPADHVASCLFEYGRTIGYRADELDNGDLKSPLDHLAGWYQQTIYREVQIAEMEDD